MRDLRCVVPVVCLMALVVTEYLLVDDNSGSLLSATEMQAYRGGYDKYCVYPTTDPNAIHCNQCTSNGNGGSTRCTNAHYSQIDVADIFPDRVSFDQTACGGLAPEWYSPNTNCGGPPNTSAACGRNYIKATRHGWQGPCT